MTDPHVVSVRRNASHLLTFDLSDGTQWEVRPPEAVSKAIGALCAEQIQQRDQQKEADPSKVRTQQEMEHVCATNQELSAEVEKWKKIAGEMTTQKKSMLAERDAAIHERDGVAMNQPVLERILDQVVGLTNIARDIRDK